MFATDRSQHATATQGPTADNLAALPQSLDSERALLGSLMLGNDTDTLRAVRDRMGPDAFMDLDHRRIFEGICRLQDDGAPTDPTTVAEALKGTIQDRDADGKSTGPMLLGDIIYSVLKPLGDGVASAANAVYYADVVVDQQRRREAIVAAGRIREAAYTGNGEFEAAVADMNRLASMETDRTAGPAIKAVKIGDLLDEPEEVTPCIVDGLLPAGGFSLLASKPKVGKSTFARCLALAVSRSDRFIGRASHGGAVVYCGLEDKRAETARHFRGLGATADDALYVVTDPMTTDPRATIADLGALIRKTGAVLVIVDTLDRLARCKDYNDYGEVSRKLEPLVNLARESGCHIMALHHCGKNDGRDAGDSLLGSTALFCSVDTLLTLRRSNTGRTLQTDQRYDADMEQMTLTWDAHTRSIGLGGSVAAVEQASLGRQIVGVLEESEDPLNKREIRTAVGGRAIDVYAAVDSLHETDQIQRIGTGRRHDSYRFCSRFHILGAGTGNTNENPPDGLESGFSADGQRRCSRGSGTQTDGDDPPF